MFTPQQSFAPDTEVNLTLDTLVRASNGLLLAEPVSLLRKNRTPKTGTSRTFTPVMKADFAGVVYWSPVV